MKRSLYITYQASDNCTIPVIVGNHIVSFVGSLTPSLLNTVCNEIAAALYKKNGNNYIVAITFFHELVTK